jgi:hypothetical protein
MRKFAAVFVLVLFCGVFALAQQEPDAIPEHTNLFEIPKTEISFGYAYLHAGNVVPPNSAEIAQTGTGMNGFAVQFSHYLHNLHGNLGYMGDFSRNSNNAVTPTGVGYSTESYVAGPTYRLHRYGFFSPSIHVLGGVSHSNFTVLVNGPSVFSLTDTDFAALAGGTVDGNLTPHIAIRLAQVDYEYTHHYGANQSSFRYLGGVVIRF